MKLLFLILMFCLFSFRPADGIYDFSVTTLNGDAQSLGTYQAKKMVFVILPVTRTSTDSLFLDTLNALSLRYTDSVTIIGIPSYETGYADDSLYSYQPWYTAMLGSGIIITQGMHTGKTDPYQDGLFAWLTNKNQNGHFDNDVTGTEQAFYVNEKGELTGEVSDSIGLTDGIMQYFFHLQEDGETGQ